MERCSNASVPGTGSQGAGSAGAIFAGAGRDAANSPGTGSVAQRIDAIYRAQSRRVFATLIRLLGDFDRAEEALHEAFRTALEAWPRAGVPANPAAWLVSAGRFNAIDSLRRDRRFTAWDDAAAEAEAVAADVPGPGEQELLEDDRLRLIFICCHPSLAEGAQIALTLREVCGLTTEEIARSFLLPAPTLAQRIVRAKAKIRVARIPYRVPERDQLPARLASVLRVVYLVFNEGYSASSGATVTRHDLSDEAMRLARLLYELLPEAEVTGLLALMLLHESRRPARTGAHGDLVSLDEQNRTLWNSASITEGCALAERALAAPGFGTYALQAAISAVHAEAHEAGTTDWAQITGLYDALLQRDASPVVQLNRAVAVAMRDAPARRLPRISARWNWCSKNQKSAFCSSAWRRWHESQGRFGPTAPAGCRRVSCGQRFPGREIFFPERSI